MAWWLWVLIGMLALAGESASMALFLIYVGVAAFAAALLSLAGAGTVVQLGIFVALSLLLLGLVRPRMIQALTLRIPQHSLTNQGRMVDRAGTVIQTVTTHSGAIRVGNAEFWTARINPSTPPIEVGSPVRIVYLDGATAYVTLDDAPPVAHRIS